MSNIIAAAILALGLVGAAWIHRDRPVDPRAQWQAVRMTDSGALLVDQFSGAVAICGVADARRAGCFRLAWIEGAAPPPSKK